jgi:hypothetical protein
VVEQEGYGVREHFPEQTAGEVPQVARPHPLDGVAPAQLRKDGVYPVAKTAKEGTPLRSGISLFGGVRGQKLYTHPLQLFFGVGRVVVAISDDETRGPLDNLRYHRELVGISRGHREARDEPRPADPHVHSEAVEGLLEQWVLAVGGRSFKTRAAVSTSEQACRQRQRVAKRKGRIVRTLGQELLPEDLLDLPEVSSLPAEGGAMHASEVREEVSVVSPEVGKEFCVLVYPQKLAYDLDGEHFGVAQRWGRSATSETSEVLEAVVDEAEDRDDEGAKIHNKKTSVTSGATGSTPSVGRSSL